MTALVALERENPKSLVTIPKEACGVEGSSLYLKEGEVFTLIDLLYGVMLRSANDAAEAIAYHVSGSIEDFCVLMNEKARDLGLENTSFKNPHGLDHEEHYTTTAELALITAEALKNETFKEIVSTYKKTIKNLDGEARLIVNHNKLISLYDGAIGVKTGFTKRSGRSLVGAAERGGLTLISVTINAPDDWSDHEKLFNYGFDRIERKTLAKPSEFSYSVPVIGSDKLRIPVENSEALSIILPKGTNVNKQIKLERYLTAPIKSGDTVGEIIFLAEEKIIGKISLIAKEDANVPKHKGLFSIFKD
jgi:D-alanyl-D-alanine carboxypeptidase